MSVSTFMAASSSLSPRLESGPGSHCVELVLVKKR